MTRSYRNEHPVHSESGRRAFPARMLAIGIVCASAALHAQGLNYITTWQGNSFPGTPNQLHVQDGVNAAFVGPDGTAYTNSGWDEGGQEAGIYRAGAVVGNCGGLHGWGRSGGAAVTADATYVYLATTQNGDDGANTNLNGNGLAQYPAAGNQWYCIRRYDHNGNPSSFPAGYGYDGSMLVVNSSAKVNGGYPDLSVHGLAVSNGYLYASDPANGLVHVYNTSNMTAAGSFACAACQALAADGSGYLWILQNSGSPTVTKYNTSGTAQSAKITFASGNAPSAVVYNSATGQIMVTDLGPDQNVKLYNPASLSGSPTNPASTFGTKGGILAGSGATIGTVGALRFNAPTAVGADSNGNMTVVSSGSTSLGGTVIENYNSSGSTRTSLLYGLEFVDTAEPDPQSENDVYTKEEHFVLNYNTTTPGAEWSYKGYTANEFKYPQDPRFFNGSTCSPWVRHIGGQKFLFVTDMYVSALAIYRFNSTTDGEVAIPSGLIVKGTYTSNNVNWPANQPTPGEWIWRDVNGNGSQDANEYVSTGSNSPTDGGWGLFVDCQGNVWECGNTSIREFVCQGLDSVGNPIYNYNPGAVVTFAPPPLSSGDAWTEIDRIRYFPTATAHLPADTMFISGDTTKYPNGSGWWGIAGAVVYRYDNWSTAPVIHPGYPIFLPDDASGSVQTPIVGIDVAGEYLFAGQSRAPQTITIYDVGTAAQVGTMVPGADLGGPGSTGWLDFRDPIHAFQRANGEYLLFVEDDALGKQVIYRWSGYTDADIGGPGQAGSASYFTPASSTWTVAGGGSDIWNNSDQFNFASAPAAGDLTMAAEVTSMTNTDGWAKSGVMFRDSSAAGSMFVAMEATAGNGVTLQWRNATNGGCGYTQISGVAAPTPSNPVWVKLVKNGGSFTGYYSLTGTSWTLVGSTSVSFVNATYLAGLAVTAHNNGLLNTSTFSNVCAAPPGTDADIGSPGKAGSGSYNNATGVWTVTGGGSDIWNNSDQFNFESKSLTGDGTIVAQVTSITNTDPWAKAGVMFRDTNAAGSMFVAMEATQGNGVTLQWRNATGGGCGYAQIGGIPAPSQSNPVWVKLVKTGTNYAGYYSPDGVNWTLVGWTTVSFVNNTTYPGGLAVTAHNNNLLNTATFANVLF